MACRGGVRDVVYRRCEHCPPAAKRDDGVDETLEREPACTRAERDIDSVERCHDDRVSDPEHVAPGDRYRGNSVTLRRSRCQSLTSLPGLNTSEGYETAPASNNRTYYTKQEREDR